MRVFKYKDNVRGRTDYYYEYIKESGKSYMLLRMNEKKVIDNDNDNKKFLCKLDFYRYRNRADLYSKGPYWNIYPIIIKKSKMEEVNNPEELTFERELIQELYIKGSTYKLMKISPLEIKSKRIIELLKYKDILKYETIIDLESTNNQIRDEINKIEDEYLRSPCPEEVNE